jgi:hypothetical protein
MRAVAVVSTGQGCGKKYRYNVFAGQVALAA